MRNWLKKIRGSIVLEAALTIPVVFYMIFFTLELIHMNEMQIKLNAIVEECTMDLAVNKLNFNSESIFNKYGMSEEDPRVGGELLVFKSLDNVMSASPYGGCDIFVSWSDRDYLETTADSPVNVDESTLYTGYRVFSGQPFMFTITYKYQFSSSFVAKLFNGGTNTKNGTAYLLWARGVGIFGSKSRFTQVPEG